MAERHATAKRERDLEVREDALDERPGVVGRAHDDRDLLGGHARVEQPPHLRGDQLELGALAAGLHERHRRARLQAGVRAVLEQPALEPVQRRARLGRVVLGARLERDDLVGQRAQLLERRRASREGEAPRLRPGSCASDSVTCAPVAASVSTASRCSGVRSSKP